MTREGDNKAKVKKNRLRQYVIIVFAILILGIIGGFVAYQIYQARLSTVDPGNVFVIDGKQYTKEEVLTYVPYYKVGDYTDDQAARQVFDALKIVRAAEKTGFTVTDKEVDKVLSSSPAIKDDKGTA